MLHKGDAVAGSVALVVRDRRGEIQALSRVVGPAGTSIWQVAATGDSIGDWTERQRRYDPDLWVIELDTPDPARFIDETIG